MILTTDMKLIHGILQTGMSGYHRAVELGVSAEILHDEARSIFGLMERLSKLGRLPSITEMETAISFRIEICPDPIDVELIAQRVVKRALAKQLNDRLDEITSGDVINERPHDVRDLLQGLLKDVTWSHGTPWSLNSQPAIEALRERYTKAEQSDGGLLGLSSPWEAVDESSLGLQPGELTVIYGKRKQGKTICGETVMHDPVSGQETTLRDVVENERAILTWDEGQLIEATEASDFLDSGKKECIRIIFRSGRSVVAAPTHPFKTPGGWVKAGDLQEGHHVAAAARFPAPTRTQSMDEHEICVLALMIAEGGCTGRTPCFTSMDPEIVASLDRAVERLGWTCELRAAAQPGHYPIASHDANDANEMTRFLDQHGVMGKRSIDKEIPNSVFSLPDHQLGRFIGFLWSCDGTVQKDGVVSYSTGSRRLADQVQHLLLRFGVTSRVRTMGRTTKNGPRDYYEVVIRREHIGRFKAHIKLIGPKVGWLKKVSFRGKSRVGWLKNEEIREHVYKEIDADRSLLQDVGEELGYSFKFQKGHMFDTRSGRVRKKVFAAFADVYDSSLKWLLDENIEWDEIVCVESAGERHCYDLSIPETHCFVANDYMLHNTWITVAWAMHIWENDLAPGDKVLFVTMEMTKVQIIQRMAAVALKLSYGDFRAGRLTTDDRKRFMDWCDERIEAGEDDECDLVMLDSSQVSVVADLGFHVAKHKPKLVVVDSFYILGRAGGQTLHERVLTNVQALKKDIAVPYDVSVLASTQLKGTKNKDELTADSDDAMGAKAIGDYADSTRGLMSNKTIREAKQRHFIGMEAREFIPKSILMNFDLDTMDFSQVQIINPGETAAPASKPAKPTAAEVAEALKEDDDTLII